MYIEVTFREAARLLSRGRMVWDGCDSWACGVQLSAPHRWRKARKLRRLERKLRGPWSGYSGKWYIIQRT